MRTVTVKLAIHPTRQAIGNVAIYLVHQQGKRTMMNAERCLNGLKIQHLFESGEHERAVAMADECLKAETVAFHEIYSLGRALTESNDLVRCLKLHQLLCDAGPEHAHHWFLLGVTLGNLEMHEESLRASRYGLTVTPDDCQGLRNAAVSCVYLDLFEEGINHSQAILRQNSEDIGATKLMGYCLSQLHGLGEFLSIPTDLESLEVDDLDDITLVMMTWHHLDKDKEALELFEILREKAPHHAEKFENLFCHHA